MPVLPDYRYCRTCDRELDRGFVRCPSCRERFCSRACLEDHQHFTRHGRTQATGLVVALAVTAGLVLSCLLAAAFHLLRALSRP